LTILAAIVAVLAVRVVAFAVMDLSPEFQPLTWGAPIFFTIVLVGMGVLVFAAVVGRATHPIRAYRRIAFWALVVSFIPDLLLPGSGPGATWPAAFVLMVMHIAAWWTTVAILTRWAIRQKVCNLQSAICNLQSRRRRYRSLRASARRPRRLQ
jgi:hypothetical protein